MISENKLLRIFWPQDVSKTTTTGALVGWRSAELDIFVLTCLENVNPRNAEHALRVGVLFRNSPHPIARLLQLCGNAPLEVVGTLNQPGPEAFDASNLTFVMHRGSRFPRISCSHELGITAQVILYRKPSPSGMQYMSLKPISLALVDKDFLNAPRKSDPDYDQQMELIQKMRLHTVVTHTPSSRELLLPAVLAKINCATDLTQVLSKNMHLIGTRQQRKMSVSELVVESASNAWSWILRVIWHFLTVWVIPLVTKTFKIGLICHRIVGEGILRVLEWRLQTDSSALKDVSDIAQQVDIRLQQFCYWPIQYYTLRNRKRDWDSVTDSHPDYIRFYNSLWLVANDVIMGIALGSYIIENADWFALFINDILTEWTVLGLRGMIEWLTDWPAGLKLNNELASFLADLVIWVIEYWSHCLDGIRPILPHLIRFVGFAGFAGATMPIALFSDLLSLLTMHVYSFYVASTRIYHWQLTIIISLFHLFRGKKHNVLRNRIDSCDYDLDQLLLGTILFTVLTFLLPTVLVFYLTFALSRMAIITLKAVLDTMLAFLNHFPLFALMLRAKDPWRLPGALPGPCGASCLLTKLRRHKLRAT